MAFTVEDDTGLAGANSYTSLAEYQAYHTDRDNEDALDATDAEIQAALIRATDYVEWRFSARYKGRAEFPETQALGFPRLDLYDRNSELVEGVPTRLKNAVSEYAARALLGDLAPDPTYDASGRAVVSRRRKVGPVETEVHFEQGAAVSHALRAYPAADAMIAEYLRAGGGVTR